jgi:hypothetical protein
VVGCDALEAPDRTGIPRNCRFARGVLFGGLLEVAAGAERAVAGSGVDADPGVVVVDELLLGRAEVGAELAAERVHPVGTVEGDDADVAALLV